MFVTKKRLLEEVRKAKLEGIAEGKQDLERQVEMSKERGIKEGYNRGFTDRTNYYTMSVIPELKGKIMALEFKLKESEEGQEKAYQNGIEQGELNRNINYTNVIIEEERKQHKETIANYEVANKSLREIGERLMFRVGELKDEKEEQIELYEKKEKENRRLYWSEIYGKVEIHNLKKEIEVLKEQNNDLDNYNTELICQLGSLQMDLAEQEEVKMNNDLYDFQEIKRLEELMKKVKRVKVKKKIQSRIDKLMIRGL